ncbi:MAG: M3 family metallopeptidase [Acidobacteriota bacterium]|nr:MAG: M3 family metallopeptidase [Acidobacteriota bacterium]
MKYSCVALIFVMGLISLNCAEEPVNPFLSEWQTPFGVPPFSEIGDADYLPAFREGIAKQKEEVEAIASNVEPASFENTVVALETSGELLRKVGGVFFNLRSANTNDQIQQIAKELSPMLSKHNDEILLNAPLFKRIEAVYEAREGLDLDVEDRTLLEETYKEFVRGGASLDEGQKERLIKINEQLALLSVEFGENVLKETNEFALVIEDREGLAGLPDSVVSAAAEAAAERGMEGKWVITLHKPSLIPFLQYSERRELRERAFRGYTERGNQGNQYDNNDIVARTAELRAERAGMLGFETHADYVLDESMAKKPEAVYELLNKLWAPSLEMAREEAALLQTLGREDAADFRLEPWDWWFYAERVRQQRYELNEEELRPYFQLEKVRDGAFEVANKLYGLTFHERDDLPTYHPDVQAFEVQEADGSHVGVLYLDYFPRESKRGGAWMNSYRKQSGSGGDQVTPVICNVCNFSKPTGDVPALLSLEEVGTLFHEFGHALHGLLSQCRYESLSGTAVPRDFVELPSQIMENWASNRDVMKSFARHYQTGEAIPDELIDKIEAARQFNQGFVTVEYLAAAFLDMNWHTLTGPASKSVGDFEREALDQLGLIPEIVVRYRSPYFSHIFSGGYASGYYSYIWAEVLDADAFEAFKERGLFDQETASSFRQNILSRGGSEEPMKLYLRFRGSEPRIEPLLERKGLISGE